MDSAMYLNLYLGLLSASAIVATLLPYKPRTIKHATMAKLIIILYGVSALASASGIMEVMIGTGSILIIGTFTLDYLIADISLSFFIAGTEALMLTAYYSIRLNQRRPRVKKDK